MNTKNTCLDLL